MGLDIFVHSVNRSNPEDSIEINYFRKVNFLAYFFNPRNCMPFEARKELLEDLKDRCNKVLQAKDAKVSQELLRTQEGFFFGSTEYDEDYYYEVQKVFDFLNELLPNFDFENRKVEFYFWW